MKKTVLSLLAAVLLSTTAQARDTRHLFSIADAMASPAYEGRLDESVKFYFGDQPQGEVIKTMGDFVSNKKTNAFGKSDIEACEWVLLSALLSLQERALALGGNAVINIRSYYKKNEMSSSTEYECHAGTIMAGVALKGTVAKIK